MNGRVSSGVVMSVDTELYRVRIGTFYGTRTRMKLRERRKVDSTIWFTGLVLAIPLVVGGVEDTEIVKIDQILAHVKNQEGPACCNSSWKLSHEIGDMNEGRDERNCYRVRETECSY